MATRCKLPPSGLELGAPALPDLGLPPLPPVPVRIPPLPGAKMPPLPPFGYAVPAVPSIGAPPRPPLPLRRPPFPGAKMPPLATVVVPTVPVPPNVALFATLTLELAMAPVTVKVPALTVVVPL
jgi:hypothetical protein